MEGSSSGAGTSSSAPDLPQEPQVTQDLDIEQLLYDMGEGSHGGSKDEVMKEVEWTPLEETVPSQRKGKEKEKVKEKGKGKKARREWVWQVIQYLFY